VAKLQQTGDTASTNRKNLSTLPPDILAVFHFIIYTTINMRVINFNNKKIRVETRDEADRSVLNEIFKYYEYRIAEDVIKNAKIIIDAGAHAGFFALYASTLNPKAEICCLEPEPNNFEQLNKHIGLNKINNVTTYPFALSDKTRDSKLYLSEDTHNHSLINNNQKSITIKTINLNDLANLITSTSRQIDLLKMDIEGAEKFIINDIENWPAVKNIIFEYHGATRKLADKLREHKYKVQVFPSQFDKKFGIIFANLT